MYIRQDQQAAANLVGSLTVNTIVRNSTAMEKHPALKYAVLDAKGVVVKEAVLSALPLSAGAALEFRQSITVADPHAWNGRKDPYLYTLRVSTLDGETVTDVVEQPVGFRSFHVDPQQGFFINGQHLGLHGVSRHQDHLDEGWAIKQSDYQLDFDNMMEMGCTRSASGPLSASASNV